MDLGQFDQLLNPVISVSRKGEIKYFNHICSIFFKQPPRKLSKLSHISELITTDSINFDDIINEVYESQNTQISPEISFKNEDIGEMTLILKFIYLNGDVIINILDFSIEKQLHEKYKQQVMELKETHEQILAADKLTALGEMIAGISHEVSTPLTIVNDRLMHLSDALSHSDLKAAKGYLTELQQEYNRVMRIISGMQSFVRNEEDEFIITDINKLLVDVEEFFQGLNYPESYKIKVEDGLNMWVMANPLKLQQVLINLIKNSFDAFKGNKQKEGLVTISLAQDDMLQSNIIKVSDNGPGIEKDNQDKVFDMFFTTKSIGEGTGLGLSITKKILEAHNGNIELLDQDQGTTFQINLPIIEVGSFTQTNKYLKGETEFEGDKILIYGKDLDLLNEVFTALKDRSEVLVFSRDLSKMNELADFLMIDKAVLLSQGKLEFNVDEVLDLSAESTKDIIKAIKEKL
jgi:signal transduction histidine kinase